MDAHFNARFETSTVELTAGALPVRSTLHDLAIQLMHTYGSAPESVVIRRPTYLTLWDTAYDR